MYCYTYAANFTCVINEILLWSDISSEHPIFVKTVASLTGKKLPPNLASELDGLNKDFGSIKERAEKLRLDVKNNPFQYAKHINMARALINEFLIHDSHALKVYPAVAEIGKEDKVWQTLLHHIIHEQTFMYELFTDLKKQLSQGM